MNLEVITRKPESRPRATPILFVHGAWHAAWCWAEHFLPYFANKGYESHALSLRDHGKSDSGERFWRVRMTDYLSDIAQVADRMQTPPIIVGHSLGGLIVPMYLEDHEAPAAVLMATAHKGTVSSVLRVAQRHPIAFLISMVTLRSKKSLAKGELFSKDMPAEKVASYFARMQDEHFVTGRKLPKLEMIKTPVLLLGGQDDTIIHVDQMEATAHDYNTKAEIFPHMAHDMMLEADWQDVADRIVTWLQERGL